MWSSAKANVNFFENSFKSIFYLNMDSNLQSFLIKKFLEHPGSTLAENGECQLYNGPTRKDNYCYLTYFDSAADRNKMSSIQRLSYWLAHPKLSLSPKMHVSHLCHNKRCIKPEHLVYETAKDNCGRRPCARAGQCLGGHAPACLANLKLKSG